MTRAIEVVLFALGAVAVLVVVNWAKQELVVGLVAAACLVIIAMTLAARKKKAAEEDETPPTS